MTAIRDPGLIAGEDVGRSITSDGHSGIAYWVCAKAGTGMVLSSSSYASCVGVALYSISIHGGAPWGAVIHFWNPASVSELRNEILPQYIEEIGFGYLHDAVVFGGTELNNQPLTDAAKNLTLPRINAISEFLSIQSDVNRVIKINGRGSYSVSLDLTHAEVPPSKGIAELVHFDTWDLKPGCFPTLHPSSIIEVNKTNRDEKTRIRSRR